MMRTAAHWFPIMWTIALHSNVVHCHIVSMNYIKYTASGYSLHFFIQTKNNLMLKKQENYADYEKYFFWIFRIKIYMEKIIFLKKNPQK